LGGVRAGSFDLPQSVGKWFVEAGEGKMHLSCKDVIA
jgi:hypothetical protein